MPVMGEIGMESVKNAPRSPTSEQLSALGVDTLAGSLVAVLTLCYAVGYGAMIFSGGLAPWVQTGLPTALISCVVVSLVIALTTSVPFMIGGPDSNAAALLAGLASGVAIDVRAGGGSDRAALASVLVTLAVASVGTGVVLYALGRWKRGNSIQYIPFPVVGGFLAGTGFLIVEGAFRIITNEPMSFATLPMLFRLPWFEVVPALLVAVGLLVGTRLTRHIGLMPLVILLGILVFYAGLRVSGQSVDGARQMGLLFHLESIRNLRLPFTQLHDAWFATVFSHMTEILAVAAVSGMTVLLSATSIGLSTSRDIDFNRELRSAGFANVLTGLFGGIVGYQSMSRTMMSWRAGATGRRAGVLSGLFCLVVIVGFPGLIELFPKPVLAGLQLYLGSAMLIEWLFNSFKRLPWHDYLLIPLIMVIIASYGIVAGVSLGVVAASLLFVVRYGRVKFIRTEFNGAGRRSHVERTVDQNRLLDQQAARLYGVGLQGFLFFGTAYSILTHIRSRIEEPEGAGGSAVRFVLVDFSQVHGVDASSTASFVRLGQACVREGAQLVLTGLPTPLQAWFRKGGLLAQGAHEFNDLDGGLEWIEERLLENAHVVAQGIEERGESRLPESLRGLRPHLEPIALAAGEFLFRQADPGDSVYFVDDGRVTVGLTLAGGKTIRLRSFGAGTIVGEMAVYTGTNRSADVVADVPTAVLRLPLDTLKRLEADEPALASQFHEFVVKVLAARLAVANEQIRAAY
jgi:SulP family sulfate permease